MLLPWVTHSAGSTGPFRGAKHVLYEGGIRVPAIIRWPALTKPGAVITEKASTLDLLPTLAGAAGCDLPADHSPDGGDIRPALAGGMVERPHALYWQYDRSRENASRGEHFTSPPLALREARWKLMAEADFSAPRLYNLDFDRGEKWNLAETYPERTKQMLETLKAIHADVAASAAAVPRDAYINELLPPPSKTPLHLG
jgi:arylsulfatase A-like enzyme